MKLKLKLLKAFSMTFTQDSIVNIKKKKKLNEINKHNKPLWQ